MKNNPSIEWETWLVDQMLGPFKRAFTVQSSSLPFSFWGMTMKNNPSIEWETWLVDQMLGPFKRAFTVQSSSLPFSFWGRCELTEFSFYCISIEIYVHFRDEIKVTYDVFTSEKSSYQPDWLICWTLARVACVPKEGVKFVNIASDWCMVFKSFVA